MAPPGQPETEPKYDAGPSTPLPELMDIPDVKRIAEGRTDHLEAVDSDTRTLALAARRITLRRRTGGADHGWQLELSARDDRRQELQAPLGQPETVPVELTAYLHAYTRGQAVLPDRLLRIEKRNARSTDAAYRKAAAKKAPNIRLSQ